MTDLIYWIAASQAIMVGMVLFDVIFPPCREYFRLYPWPFTREIWGAYRSFDLNIGWTPYQPSWFRLQASFRYYPHITLSVLTTSWCVRLGRLRWVHQTYRAYGQEWA